MERRDFWCEAAGGEGDHELGASGDGGVEAGFGARRVRASARVEGAVRAYWVGSACMGSV